MIKDLSETRIPNPIILIGLISGVFYRVVCLGDRNYIEIVMGIVFPIVVFFPLFLIRAMGAGDIKLFALTGAFFTLGENVKCIVTAIFIGGAIALIKVLICKSMRERMKYMLAYFGNLIKYAVAGNTYDVPYIDKENREAVKQNGIKFSLPILLSVIIIMGGSI